MIPTAPTCTCNTGSLLAVLTQIKLDSWIQYIYIFGFFSRDAESSSSYPKILHVAACINKQQELSFISKDPFLGTKSKYEKFVLYWMDRVIFLSGKRAFPLLRHSQIFGNYRMNLCRYGCQHRWLIWFTNATQSCKSMSYFITRSRVLLNTPRSKIPN